MRKELSQKNKNHRQHCTNKLVKNDHAEVSDLAARNFFRSLFRIRLKVFSLLSIFN